MPLRCLFGVRLNLQPTYRVSRALRFESGLHEHGRPVPVFSFGSTVKEIASDYDLQVEYVEQRLAAAQLCFDKQVDHIEFANGCWA